jgi:hypothetical protein
MQPQANDHLGVKVDQPNNRVRLVRALRLLSIVPIVGAGAYLLFFAPSPISVSVVNATVESFAFEVKSPELMKIPLRGFNLSGDFPAAVAPVGPAKSKPNKSLQAASQICFSGVLTPSEGTHITYTRFGDDPVSISIDRSDEQPVGEFLEGSQDLPTIVKLTSHLKLTAVAKDDNAVSNCIGRPVPRLPVYGNGDLGSETSPTGQSSDKNLGTLIEGTVDVLAHAVKLNNEAGAIAPSNVYSTNSQIILPPGSRLVEFTPEGSVKHPWVGFAVIGDSSIELHVTSDARQLAIIRPGRESKPEILSVGLLSQVANDPMLASVQIVGALLFSVFQLFGVFFSGSVSRRPFDF